MVMGINLKNTNIISGIYMIFNTINGKCYIGSSKNIIFRIKRHIRDLNKQRHDNSYLQRAWDKYGLNNFHYYIIQECEPKELIMREQEYVSYLNCHYNICRKVVQTCEGVKRSEETKRKMSISQKGKTHTEETKEKLRIINIGNTYAKGNTYSIEQKQIMSDRMKGKSLHCTPHTEESKRKISESKKGVIPNREYKGTQIIDKNGNVYKSVAEASRQLDINKSNLHAALKGFIENKYGVSYLL